MTDADDAPKRYLVRTFGYQMERTSAAQASGGRR
jgi:hypothetical protein